MCGKLRMMTRAETKRHTEKKHLTQIKPPPLNSLRPPKAPNGPWAILKTHSDTCVGFWRSLTSECCCTDLQGWIKGASASAGKTPACHAELIPSQSQGDSRTGQQHGAVFRDQAVPAVRHPQEPTGGWLCRVRRVACLDTGPTNSLPVPSPPLQEAVKQLELQLASPRFLRQLDVHTVKLWPHEKLQRERMPSAAGGTYVSAADSQQQGQPHHPGVAPDLRRRICLPLDAHDMPAAVPQCCPGRAWQTRTSITCTRR